MILLDDLVIYEKKIDLPEVINIKNNGPYHDKPGNEGSSGHIDTVIPQLGATESVEWL